MDTVEQITGRQLEVARLVAEGRSNPEIAEALGVSLAGAKYHVSELLGRLGVSSREEIAEWYRRHGRSVQPRPQWRQRLRGLIPFGVLLGSGAAAAVVVIALSGGRDDSGLPVAAVTETATAVTTEPASGSSPPPFEFVDHCWLGGWQAGIWPGREGTLQPSYFPDGWRVYEIQGLPDDWDAPGSDCSFDDLQIVLAPDDAPLRNAGETVEDWIAFTQIPSNVFTNAQSGGRIADITTDESVPLSSGRVAFRSISDGAERLAWEQDGYVALLVSPSVAAAELVRIAESTRVADTSPKIPLFWEYEIQPDDTLEGIAAQFGVSVETLIWNNVDLDRNLAQGAPNQFFQILTPGTRIQIPTVEGVIHSVTDGDTVASVAERYDADERDIVEFRANGLDGAADNLEPGSLILVPGGTRFAPAQGPPPTATGGDQWTWPVEGELKTPFGPEHPVGIDIRVPLETEVRAARDGAITFAGGDTCCDEGYHVIIEHEDGYETLYGHLAEFTRQEGSFVSAGDVIATVGMTGETDEPHLHFEIRRAGVYQDPLNFLP